jgi:hypothetical protein
MIASRQLFASADIIMEWNQRRQSAAAAIRRHPSHSQSKVVNPANPANPGNLAKRVNQTRAGLPKKPNSQYNQLEPIWPI